MAEKKNTKGVVGVRLSEAQRSFLERQVEQGKAKNISEVMQNLINKAMFFG